MDEPTTPCRERMLAAVYRAVDEVNAMRPPGEKIDVHEATRLTGPGGALDSLGMVNFIVALESQVAEEFGVAVSLASGDAVDRWLEIFASAGDCADYLCGVVDEHGRI